MGSFGIQLKQILRRLSRAPLFTAITLLTLAAAIGANTAIFSVLEGVLFKPLPYPNPEELVSVSQLAPGLNSSDVTLGPSDYLVFKDQNKVFKQFGLYTSDAVSVTGSGEPERVRALRVTESTISLLGIPPSLGRWFNHDDDAPGNATTAMITYGFWQRRFGGDPSVVGRNIQVDGKSAEVIGIMPKTFRFLAEEDPDVILPLQFDSHTVRLGAFAFHGLARLKPGVTIADVVADEARMFPIVLRSFPMPQGFSVSLFENAGFTPLVKPLKLEVVGDVSKSLWILMGSLGMVMLIACANVANLLLVRVEGRRQELAVRSALGASWGRIAYDLLLESGVLGIMGSVLGLGIAYVLLHVLVGMAPNNLPRIHEIGIDGPVLLFTLFVSLLAGLLIGLIPILKYAGARPSASLREGGRGQSAGREQHRARSVLVVVQVALALVLLICSGLMLRTFMALSHVRPGFTNPESIQTFGLSVPKTEADQPERVARLYEEVLHRIGAIPGVSSAGLSNSIPMDGTEEGFYDSPLYAEDHAYQSGKLPPLRNYKVASPGYLATMGMPVIAGRDFSWDDLYKNMPSVMISENLARELWGDPSAALGKRVREGEAYAWQEIIGVVGDVHDDGVDKAALKSIYWPIVRTDLGGAGSRAQRVLAVAVRSPQAGSQGLIRDLQKAVWTADGNLPLANPRTVEYFYKRSMAQTTFTLMLLAIAGSMALLLGSVGIYGVIAYSVSQRTREIGIRMALGAQQSELTGMFLRHGLVLVGIGVASGLVVAVMLSRVLASLVFPVSALDPATYAAVVVALFATALLASYLPSRRASTVDPIEALRAE